MSMITFQRFGQSDRFTSWALTICPLIQGDVCGCLGIDATPSPAGPLSANVVEEKLEALPSDLDQLSVGRAMYIMDNQV